MSPRTAEANQIVRDERREQILRAALKIFATKGLKGTKISDIAAAAKISQGLIHHYYESKEQVYVAVAERAMAGALQAIQQMPEGEQEVSPWQRLTIVCERMLQGLTVYPEYLLVIVQCLVQEDVPKEAHKLVSKYGRSVFSNLVQLIRDGQAAGQVAAGDPEQLALIFIATVQGLSLTQFTRSVFTGTGGSRGRELPPTEIVLRLLKG
jgi:AcrR family transcriptional regulator